MIAAQRTPMARDVRLLLVAVILTGCSAALVEMPALWIVTPIVALTILAGARAGNVAARQGEIDARHRDHPPRRCDAVGDVVAAQCAAGFVEFAPLDEPLGQRGHGERHEQRGALGVLERAARLVDRRGKVATQPCDPSTMRSEERGLDA